MVRKYLALAFIITFIAVDFSKAGIASGSIAEEPGLDKSLSPPTKLALKYAINHVIFSDNALDLYTTGPWAKFVRPQDSFMLMSGNQDGKIDTEKLNQWARAVLAHHPSVPVYAGTSSLDNVRRAGGLNPDLFAGLVMVYEPNFPNASEFTWDKERTEEIWRKAAAIIREQGIEAWAKPSGRALQGRDKAGQWDYGVLATIMDGMNVQTQGSCKNGTFPQALNDLLSQYQAAGAESSLWAQITVGDDQTHAVSPAKAFDCAKAAWAAPPIDRVTLWPELREKEKVAEYLGLREKLLATLPPP